MTEQKTGRIYSIDVFRAMTMLLMIFVNDFWTLENIPQWLKHMPAQADGLGFSDVIFPAFLFIVGLSIPFAIDKRQTKESLGETFYHILSRSIALIVMGVFLVNLESIYPDAMSIPKVLWQILLIAAFFLIWNNYRPTELKKTTVNLLMALGVLILIGLAILYKGGNADEVTWMQRHWWGILGLIGWAYFYCATIYLLTKGNLTVVIGAAIFFLLYNLLSQLGLLDFMEGLGAGAWFGNASNQSLVMLGVVSSAIYQKQSAAGHQKVLLTWVVLGVVLLALGFVLRPYGGISKIRATPAWVGICAGISLLAYAFFYWLVDVKEKKAWAQIIEPAGKSTLTCYLVPYVYYAIWSIWAVTLPAFLRTGIVGLLKSLLFALLIVGITGILNRYKISLKI